mmetsp:Transcript_82723/g.177262  ORF Transcript_82723/g.177262 Transcript_82723/m.177262 type:complete len:315 (-) Transcript_82723:180-1124(-)
MLERVLQCSCPRPGCCRKSRACRCRAATQLLRHTRSLSVSRDGRRSCKSRKRCRSRGSSRSRRSCKSCRSSMSSKSSTGRRSSCRIRRNLCLWPAAPVGVHCRGRGSMVPGKRGSEAKNMPLSGCWRRVTCALQSLISPLRRKRASPPPSSVMALATRARCLNPAHHDRVAHHRVTLCPRIVAGRRHASPSVSTRPRACGVEAPGSCQNGGKMAMGKRAALQLLTAHLASARGDRTAQVLSAQGGGVRALQRRRSARRLRRRPGPRSVAAWLRWRRRRSRVMPRRRVRLRCQDHPPRALGRAAAGASRPCGGLG